MTRALLLGLTLGVLLVACGGDEEDPVPDVDCSSGEAVPTFAQVTAFSKCTTCHSSTLSGPSRLSAPANINFDTYAAAMGQADHAASEVAEGAMPPAGTGLTLTQAEKDQLYRWVMCGQPQ